MDEYHGVEMDNPAIVSGINNAIARGYNKEQICKIIGVPPEVVESLQRRAETKAAGKKRGRPRKEV